MTEIVPIPPAVPDAGPDPAVDSVLAARAVSDGEHIAGLILAAQLDTVGSPRKLPMDLFPHPDPEVQALVQEAWSRALVVGVRAGKLMASPRFYRDKLATLRGQLEEAGHAAMGRAMGPAVAAAHRAPVRHPVDGELEREHL
jgi:hypothetical protein